MEEKNEKKVRSIRLDDAMNEEFKALCNELGGHNECMTALVEAYKLNRSKSVLTDMTADINEFEGLINRIVSAYTHALALKQDAEINAKETVEHELKAKDDVINRLSDELRSSEQALKDKSIECSEYIKEADNKLSDAVRDVSEANETISRLISELNTSKTIAADKQTIIDELKVRVPETEKLQAELKEKDAAIEKTNTQHVVEKTELNNKISGLNNTIASLSSEIEKLKSVAEITEQKHQLELEKAIIDEKKKYIDEIEKLRQEIYELKTKKADSDTADAESEQLTF